MKPPSEDLESSPRTVLGPAAQRKLTNSLSPRDRQRSVSPQPGDTKREVDPAKRAKALDYFRTINAGMKELIDKAKEALAKEENYEVIYDTLQNYKDECTILLMSASHTIFDEQYIKVEDFINENTSQQAMLRNDAEVQQEITNFLQIMTDWKVEMRAFLAKSPLLEDPV